MCGRHLWVLVLAAIVGSQEPPSLADRLEHAKAILREVPLVDGHNDLIMNVRTVLDNRVGLFPFEEDLTQLEPWASRPNCHTDLPRLREGLLGAQFWSIFVPCSSQYKNAFTQTIEQLDAVHRLIQKYPDDLQFVTTADGILEAHAEGKIGSLMGVEGGHSMDSSLAALRIFYNEGVRYMTLTHSCNTPWVDGCAAEADGTMEFGGLTEWGELVVKEMNRLGMLVDLSHVAADTMRDVLAITRAPVIFSHSNARGVYDVTRNIPDDVLLSLKDNGGIAMVNFVSFFLSDDLETTNISTVAAHINYIRDLIGVDHVGIGSDFEGTVDLPIGLEDTSRFPYLLAELLLDPSWTDEDLRKLVGLNLVRVLREAERVRDSLAGEAPWDLFIPEQDLANHTACTNPF